MPRYIDADELYKATQKRIAEANEARMAVVDDEFLDLIDDAFTEDVAPRVEWISIYERLPDRPGRFLAYSDGVSIVNYTPNYTLGEQSLMGRAVWFLYDSEWGDYEIEGVTHWMPMPEPPEGE